MYRTVRLGSFARTSVRIYGVVILLSLMSRAEILKQESKPMTSDKPLWPI